LGDPLVSRAHARLELTARDAVVTDLGSSNGTTVDGVAATGPLPLRPGSRIQVGADTLEWVCPGDERMRVTRSPDGRLDFDRAFAPAPALPRTEVAAPEPVAAGTNLVTVLVAGLLPVVGGLAMAALFRQPSMLLFALFGPLTALGPYLADRRGRTARRRDYEKARAQTEHDVAEHVGREDRARRTLAPDAAQLTLAATGATRGLWPRSGNSPHGLLVRVGTADVPASVELKGTPWPGFRPPVLTDAPVTVDLRGAGVLGVVGEPRRTGELVRWLLVQLATLRSPEDLRMVVISSRDGDTELAWSGWLPHVDVGEGGRAPCRVGVTGTARAARLSELRELVARRTAEARETGASAAGEEVVVLLDGALGLRRLPGMREVLRDGPAVGVFSICVDEQDMNECRALCRFADGGLELTAGPAEPPTTLRPEGLDVRTAERLARALAPMRDRLTLAGAQAAVPSAVRYLDLAGLPTPSAADVRARWSASPGPVTEVVLGADGSGPVSVDLARQGPHTMLGGATGAGKSILLQTLVTALLLANRPDELNLVLVDFKGGSAFLPFENCPHVVSLIRSTGQTPADVFDEAAAIRVLASVRAEVRRRESLLARYGGELDEYWKARRTGPDLPPLPRLVLIFDEFARVLEVSPDFLRELVNVAAKGRSLGMHLVLATQSLQGKLSAELKNNIDLRITLRQNEPADSVEVLGAPDAAGIPGHLRGRGMILCTKDEARVPRVFQSGYLGDPPPREGAAPARVRVVGWTSLGDPRPETTGEHAAEVTDQSLVIAAIEQAARELGLAAPTRPLLAPLPAAIDLSTVDAVATSPPAPTAVPYGLVDEPACQAQVPAVLNLAGSDRVMIAGGPQSGRTTAARALITSLVTRFGPDEAHLYVIEHQSGGLHEYAGLPHCGAVLSPAEPDRIRRFVCWLDAEVQRRKVGPADPGGRRNPWIVVVVDGWEQFENRSDPAFVETSILLRLRGIVTAGAPVGVHVVALGGQEMLSGRLPALFSRRILLPFPQEDLRRAHLHAGAVRPPLLPGRAVDAATGAHLQVARVDPAVVPAPRQAAAGHPGRAARRFPSLPVTVDGTELDSEGETGTWIPVGVGGVGVGPVGLDLFETGPHLLLVSGPPASGRTSAAAALAYRLRRIGIGVLAVAPPRSPLPDLLPLDAGVQVVTGSTIKDAELRDAAALFGDGRFAVVIDDCDQLTLVPAQEGFTDVPTLLQDVASPAALGRQALVLAGDALPILSGQRRSLMRVVNEVMTAGTRLVLTPADAVTAREHGLSLEPDQFFGVPAGRGYLACGREANLVQLALP
jgi:S-DNA-T family DNA segregation ATPase FtsK/SpoIIIE